MALRDGCVTLCWPNLIQESTLSGGSWNTKFPLSHMSDPVIQKASRTTDLQLSSTQFDMEISRFRPVSVVALLNHNISTAGLWRIRFYTDTAQTDEVWDTGWKDIWPAVYATAELEWEYDNFWYGTLDQDDIDRFTNLAFQFNKDSSPIIRSVKVEIDDQSNTDGYIKIGRLFVSDAWQPAKSAQYGIQYGYSIGTTFEVAENRNMTEYADPKIPKRTVNFTLAHMNSEEGFRRTLTLQRDQGIHQEILYTENPTPDPIGFQKTFVGRLDNPSALTHPYYQSFENSISLIEIL